MVRLQSRGLRLNHHVTVFEIQASLAQTMLRRFRDVDRHTADAVLAVVWYRFEGLPSHLPPGLSRMRTAGATQVIERQNSPGMGGRFQVVQPCEEVTELVGINHTAWELRKREWHEDASKGLRILHAMRCHFKPCL